MGGSEADVCRVEVGCLEVLVADCVRGKIFVGHFDLWEVSNGQLEGDFQGREIRMLLQYTLKKDR